MSMPCDTGLCNPNKCTDELCPRGLEMQQLSPVEKEEKVYISSPSFNVPDQHQRTNNTFINRYLENRKPVLPGEIALISRLADIETIRRLKADLATKHLKEDAVKD